MRKGIVYLAYIAFYLIVFSSCNQSENKENIKYKVQFPDGFELIELKSDGRDYAALLFEKTEFIGDYGKYVIKTRKWTSEKFDDIIFYYFYKGDVFFLAEDISRNKIYAYRNKTIIGEFDEHGTIHHLGVDKFATIVSMGHDDYVFTPDGLIGPLPLSFSFQRYIKTYGFNSEKSSYIYSIGSRDSSYDDYLYFGTQEIGHFGEIKNGLVLENGKFVFHYTLGSKDTVVFNGRSFNTTVTKHYVYYDGKTIGPYDDIYAFSGSIEFDKGRSKDVSFFAIDNKEKNYSINSREEREITINVYKGDEIIISFDETLALGERIFDKLGYDRAFLDLVNDKLIFRINIDGNYYVYKNSTPATKGMKWIGRVVYDPSNNYFVYWAQYHGDNRFYLIENVNFGEERVFGPYNEYHKYGTYYIGPNSGDFVFSTKKGSYWYVYEKGVESMPYIEEPEYITYPTYYLQKENRFYYNGKHKTGWFVNYDNQSIGPFPSKVQITTSPKSGKVAAVEKEGKADVLRFSGTTNPVAKFDEIRTYNAKFLPVSDKFICVVVQSEKRSIYYDGKLFGGFKHLDINMFYPDRDIISFTGENDIERNYLFYDGQIYIGHFFYKDDNTINYFIYEENKPTGYTYFNDGYVYIYNE